MPNLKIKKGPTPLEEEIARVMDDMAHVYTGSEEYALLLERLERLTKLKEDRFRDKITPDGVLMVVGNLLGVGIIVGYEHAHVITSKALGQLLKTK